MPRKAKELSAIAVRNLKKNGFHNVGGVTGLYLRIADSNKYWVLRFAIEGRRRDFQFAKYPETPLAEARQQAFKFRSLLNDGIDPLEWRKNKIHESILQQNQSRIANKTFKVMAEEYLQYLIDIGRYEESDRSYKLMVGRFKNHIYPAIGHILFTDVKAEHVAKILSPYRLNKPAMYKKLRYMISVIYNWARSMGYFDKEPPTNKDVLKHLLPRNCDRTVHNHPMLPIKEVPEFMNELHKKQSYSAKCLEFAILTAVRSANARKAEWSEFDFEKKEWIIPANKMKKGNENGEHVVPLSEQVIELLENIKLNQTQKCRYVFPSSKNGNSFFF